ncbi:MAG: response regulator [Lentisphaerae bacterium]|nr:response regulator [Lentisphaerota bacterium]MBT4816296.1 response regulator [Lentisphaerota bacterium]MBT5608978.1 response regulator [Lentisphaerota bacterium]MBT7056931.1 response regulator [Lentisphaerota bacterium]MBT7848497.1 response regulator [Lentisphaerota bacterium]
MQTPVQQKILIVDDKPRNLLALQKVLVDLDATIIEATNGNDALRASLHHDFSLAILDVQMPEMDGYELAELLLGDGKEGRLPIIFLTAAMKDEQDVFAGYDLGAIDYIVKPYEPRVLLSKVRTFLELDRHRVELRSHRDHLEQLVQEQTAALRKSETIHRLVVDGASVAVWDRDLSTDVTFMNDKFTSVFGYPSGRVENSKEWWHRHIHPEDAGRVRTSIERHIANGEGTWEQEYRLFRADGSCAYVYSWGVVTRDQAGEPVHMTGGVMDITDRKQAEDELRGAYQELHDAHEELKKSQAQLVQLGKMSAVGTLAAGVAHELNNPMMGILNFAQYCLKHTDAETRVHSVLEDIEREAKRCAEIVNDLLRFTRMDRDDTDALEDVQLSAVIDRVLRTLAFRTDREQITVTCSTAPSLPPVRIRANQIQQTLLNLLSNAFEAVCSRDERTVEVRTYGEGEMATVCITDSGHGISPENLSRIFDPFFTTRPVGKGTGLGLSICRTIIENHGGTITCESTVGHGTTFTVRLPLIPQPGEYEDAQTRTSD